jgi:hypothetical protein
MLVGMLAGAVPIALHLLHRIRSPIVAFPTLRFLKITALKTSRRRQLQQWFLLFLRVAMFGLLAMAIAQPFIGGGSPTLAYSLVALFLLGAALLVLAAVYGAGALDQARSQPAATPSTPGGAIPVVAAAPRPHLGLSWGLSAALLILGVLILGYASFGLTSSQYFTSQSGRYSGRSTACAIILDNSHSMLARQDSRSRAQVAVEQVRQLLADNIAPAEVAVLPTNPGETALPDRLSADTTGALGAVENLQTIGRARPMPQLIERALRLLQQSQQPHKMLVIISDMARPTFSSPDLFAALKEAGAKAPLKDFQVVLMPMSAGGAPNDVGITHFDVASGAPVLGMELTLEAEVINNGDAAVSRELELRMDDRPVPGIAPRVQIGPAASDSGRAAIKIPLRLATAGTHVFTLRIKDADDALAWDDQRQLVLTVAEQVRALVVGAVDAARPPGGGRSAARYVMTALDPYAGLPGGSGGDAGGAAAAKWSISPVYRGVERLATERLDAYSAVFMCDVPRVPAASAAALNRYVAAGHRLVWILGPSIDAASYNQAPLSELLPHTLAAPLVSALGSPVDWVDARAAVLADLFDSQEPFHSIVVSGRWGLAGTGGVPARGQTIAKLADGAPILVRQVVGRGEVFTFLTTPAADWSTLATTVAFLPLVNRMALGDPARAAGPTSYEPEQVVELPLTTDLANLAVDVETPPPQVGTRNIAAPGPRATEPRWLFAHTLQTGLYRWQTTDHKHTGEFVVNPPSEEADLTTFDTDLLARDAATDRPAIVAPSVADLLTQLDKRAEGYSLMPGVLAFVLMLLILEALLANRQRPSLRVTEATTHNSAESAASPARTAA